MAGFEEMPLPEGIDIEKANVLIRWIVKIEDENDKTGRWNDSAMVQRIGKRIQSDVKCL
jgi:hypothetical protein